MKELNPPGTLLHVRLIDFISIPILCKEGDVVGGTEGLVLKVVGRAEDDVGELRALTGHRSLYGTIARERGDGVEGAHSVSTSPKGGL